MKRSDMDQAIEYVLGTEIYNALVESSIGPPELLKMACIEAFRKGWSYDTDTVRHLRQALDMLHSPGYFMFESEPALTLKKG